MLESLGVQDGKSLLLLIARLDVCRAVGVQAQLQGLDDATVRHSLVPSACASSGPSMQGGHQIANAALLALGTSAATISCGMGSGQCACGSMKLARSAARPYRRPKQVGHFLAGFAPNRPNALHQRSNKKPAAA